VTEHTSRPARATDPGPATDPATAPDPATEPGAAPAQDAGAPEPRDLRALQRRLAAFAAARRWGPFHTPKNLAAALSVEASELLEIFQWLTPEQAARVMDDPGSAFRVRDEVADVLAYLLQFCMALGVDPLEALAAKIERNETRFPVPGEGEGPASFTAGEG
jgi:NTP pyrophosphatase (non-canonical NTP hydrolase)